MPLIGMVLAAFMRSPLPMIYPAMMFSLIAGNRGAFNPTRVFAAPIAFGGTIWLMSGIVVLLQPIPAALVLVIGTIYFLAFYLIQKTGNPMGILIIVAGVLMSVMGLGSYPAMNFLRAELTKAALCSAVVIPILYTLLPPTTAELKVDKPEPAVGYGWGTRAAIRTGVLLCYSVFLYTFIDFSNMMLAVAGMFVLAHSTRRSIWAETGQRMFSVFLGGTIGLSILTIMTVAGHLSVLMCLVFLGTYFLGHKMMTGRLPPMAYQDATSVMLSLVFSALATAEPTFAFVQRAGLTIAGTLVAALVVSILDILFVKEPTTMSEAIADRNAVENL
ncbi:hypothetical protein [Devosia sp.]|uniref:hypothetical protein n=1 Tax=Devosia sp. TaxID=1871048 RepID=UPI003BAC1C67